MEKLNWKAYIDTYELNVREEKIKLKCYTQIIKMGYYRVHTLFWRGAA